MLVFADSMGILLLYPIYQSWLNGISITKNEIKWIAGILLAISFLLSLGFTILPALVFFILPFILVLSFNVRIAGVVIISALSFISIVIATALNLGPFITTNQIETNFRLIAFVFSGSLTILGIALQNQQLSMTESSSKFWQIAAEHDPLTGLINRRAFLPILKKEHLRAMQTGKIYTLALLDLDHFKAINDRHGHHSGDKVLIAITEIMNENCRSSDSIVRMGGEEFAILFPNCTIDEAFLPLERIRANLANQPIEVSNELVYVTTSIGVASFHPDESEFELMTRADKALYAAKSAGRNLVILDKKSYL
jgi:diguanylate cyclase (GGDEF)-like protein